MSGASHLEPLTSADEADAITQFYQAFAYSSPSALKFFFDASPQGALPISKSVKIASPGQANTGNGQIGYLACNTGQVVSMPGN